MEPIRSKATKLHDRRGGLQLALCPLPKARARLRPACQRALPDLQHSAH
jgi:hypothetical protein